MKAGLFAVAAMASGAVARGHHGRHAHANFHVPRNLVTGTGAIATGTGVADATCDCSTVYYTTTGEPIIYFPPVPTTTAVPTTEAAPTTEAPTTTAVPTTPAPAPTSSANPTVPTPFVTTFPSTGVYTIPGTTITLPQDTTVVGATETTVPSAGTYTVGGVTTVVDTPTTIVVPYATTATSEGVVTSTIAHTTYVCPTAGTYTIAPLTTTASASTVWVYPIEATYPAGTYTQPEVTTTITKPNDVYICPLTSPAPASTPAPTSYAPAPEPTTYAPAPEPTYAPVPVSVSVPAFTSAAAPSSTSSQAAEPSLGGGKHWAITYTPYDTTGACKDASSVKKDVADIAGKGFKALRVYSTDCSALENIGPAATSNGIQMILGVFIDSSGISAAQEQVDQIVKWGQWDVVDLIVVGNESIMNGYVSASELAGFISTTQSTCKTAGYTGPVTTTEPLDVWQSNKGDLCGAVDVVGCNIHPFFNADVSPAKAGSFISSQLDLVDGLCPGKTGINLETGWPSSGSANGLAIPGPSEQSEAIESIVTEVGDRSVILSYANDDWKAPGPFDCEQFWGAIQLFTS